MRVGVVMYPGSNGHQDMVEYFQGAGDTVETVWHVPNPEARYDLLVLPGGFAYGDREYSKATEEYSMAPGKKASTEAVAEYIRQEIRRGTTVLGVCNGFQTLIHMGLLPGCLIRNDCGRFDCRSVQCRGVATGDTDQVLQVANEYGNYQPRFPRGRRDPPLRVILRYSSTEPYCGVNGSHERIAGIGDDEGRVFGMMPHPERTRNQPVLDWIRGLAVDRYRCAIPISVRMGELMASEHVAYGKTKECLKRLPTAGPKVIQGPGENAGIVDIGNGWAAAIRIESHNHPTFIDPYEGAATGVGGMVRDILAIGARPIGLLDFLRFGTDALSEELLPEAVRGIADYGNCLGVPNIGGDLRRGECYNKNPLMNAACIGLVRKEHIVLGNACTPGSVLVCVGGRTGREGVGGACMASQALPDDSDVVASLRPTVQTGDPFLERLLLEACDELAKAELLEGMQDLGAGGLACASIEMIQRGRRLTGLPLGCVINPVLLPTKGGEYLETGETLISESQERMLLCVTKGNGEAVGRVLGKWDLEATVVGNVTNNGLYSILNGGEWVCGWKFTDDHELGELVLDRSAPDVDPQPTTRSPPLTPLVHRTLPQDEHGVAHYEPWRQYDSTIGARTLIGSQQGRTHALLAIPEADCRLVVTWGHTMDMCVGRLDALAVGLGEQPEMLGVVNGLNFGDPEHVMPEFEAAVDRLARDCKRWGVPVLGGNVSMHNTTAGASIPGTVMLVLLARFGGVGVRN